MIKKVLNILCFISCIVSCTKDNTQDYNIPAMVSEDILVRAVPEEQYVITRASGWQYDAYFPSARIIDDVNAELRKVHNFSIILFNKKLIVEKVIIARDNHPRSTDNISKEDYKEGAEYDAYAIAGNTMTTAAQYFYTILNAPAELLATIKNLQKTGITKDEFERTILYYTLDRVTNQANDSQGYMMTNMSSPPAYFLGDKDTPVPPGSENNYYPDTNKIDIDTGWSFAKVSVAYLPDTNSTNTEGTLTQIQYRIVHNPKQLYLIPIMVNKILQTPHYEFDYNESSYASYYATYFNDNSSISANQSENWVNATTTTTAVDNMTSVFCMENSTAIPREGNTTMVLIKAQFHPNTWWDGNGNAASPSGDGSFWRIKKTSGFTEGYYTEKPHPFLVGNGEAIHYPQGITYYPIWLQTEGEYMVKRNGYHKIAITDVISAGMPTPESTIHPTAILPVITRSGVSAQPATTTYLKWQQNVL